MAAALGLHATFCAAAFRPHKTPTRTVTVSRTCTLLICSAAAKGSKLRASAEELQNPGLEPDIHTSSYRKSDAHAELYQRETVLWERQEALWQQQLAHWQHERTTWAQREAALMSHIEQLHAQVTWLLSQRLTSTNPSEAQLQPSLQPSDQLLRPSLTDSLPAQQDSSPDHDLLRPDMDSQQPPPSVTSTPSTASPAAAKQQRPDAAAAAPAGPPPVLSVGNDDIYWVNQLQTGLTNKGYYCGEEETEDFIFGDGTQSAVLTLQACCGLEESGVVDENTWKELLGPELLPAAPPPDEELLEEEAGVPVASPAGSSTPSRNRTARDPNPWEASWGDLFSSNEDSADSTAVQTQSNASSSSFLQDQSSSSLASDGRQQQPGDPPLVSSSSGAIAPASFTSTADHTPSSYIREETDYSKWSVLREGDGGRHVHELQVALMEQGFWPGDDDMQWWQFGDTTCSAVQSFQASAGLPESGVATSDTWQALLGPDATPADAAKLASHNETDDDMTQDHGGVYLVGEQRWARATSS